MSLSQLEIIQEVITLAVFAPFALFYMRQPLKTGLPLGGTLPGGRGLLRLPRASYAVNRFLLSSLVLGHLVSGGAASAQDKAGRARDLGIPLEGNPGTLNAITDVPGVAVGHTTLIKGAGRLVVGRGPVRSGVTAIFPRGTGDLSPVFAGWFSLNGNGEMTGTADSQGVAAVSVLSEERIDPVYEATVQATEEAIINALLAARTMTGADYLRVPALPHDRLVEIFRKYGRLRQ